MRVSALCGAVLLSATVLLSGCGADVPVAGGPAGPVTATPSRPSTAPTTAAPTTAPTTEPTKAPTTSPPTSRKPSPRTPVLGPEGLGALKLGMTKKQATATGLIGAWQESNLCDVAFLKGSEPDGSGAGVVYINDTGVVLIHAYGDIPTPARIRIGDDWSAVRKAYPKVKAAQGGNVTDSAGLGFADVPGNVFARFRFQWSDDRVTSIALQSDSANCYE